MHGFVVSLVDLVTPAGGAAVAMGLYAVGLGALLMRAPRLSGTTLAVVSNWSLLALLAVAGAECLISVVRWPANEPWAMAIRFVAAASTICPVMALLGAKRPQDRAWQFIVLTLWVILSLPAGHWLLFGGVREIHPAQMGLFAILIGTGAINALATRHWLAGLLYALGQVALLGPYLSSLEPWLAGQRGPFIGLALIVASWMLLALRAERSRADAGIDRVWLDFRNAFGAVWGLRVMERMNASSTMYGWPVTLTWQGFVPRTETESAVDVPAVVESSLRTLLRRFVSPEWIDERLGDGAGRSASTAEPLSASGAAP